MMPTSTDAELQYQKDRNARIATGQHEPNPHPQATGPLSVYSVARWAVLEIDGYTWDDQRQQATKAAGLGKLLIATSVPGDPGQR